MRKQYDLASELNNCTFVKTILMMLVVLDHSVAFWSGNWFTKNPAISADILPMISQWLGSFHTYGFVLVSGYLFYYIKYERAGYQKYGLFLLNKAKRLLIPYAFAAVIWVIPMQQFFLPRDLPTIVNDYVLGTSPAQLWFLLMLFLVFAGFWPLSNFCKEKSLLGVVTVMGLYCCGRIGSLVAPNVFMIWRAFSYIPLFWLGFKLRQHGGRLVREIPVVVWVLLHMILFLLVNYLSGLDNMIAKLLVMGVSFALHVIGALMAFVVLQKIASIRSGDTGCFAFFSKRSMIVYLFHQQIIYVLITWLNGIVHPYINAAVNFVGALIASVAIASLLMRFRLTRFLVGEKR